MASTARATALTTFAPSCSVVAVDSARAPDISQHEIEVLFQSVVRGERGGKLRTQLASLHPNRSAEEIEAAVQAACERFVDKAEGISAPGQVYTWIRTTAHRVLNRHAGYERHEIPVDPTGVTLQSIVSEDPGPEKELIAGEDEADLERLAQEVTSSLSERRRNVLALHGAGFRRPEIASRLGLPESTVKYDLYEIISEARVALAELTGGGCERGEPLVLRFACGLASSAESVQARLHLSRCRRCGLFSERLDAWREKAGALLPVPAAEGASPGLLERLAHRAADGISSVKQQVLGGAAQVKQQASATYYRAVDPTPLAAARPGTVAAVLASCVTIGGGAATYCVNQGVDPLGAAIGLIAGTQEPEPRSSSPSSETTEAAPAVPPATPPVSEEPATTEATPPPAEAEHKPQPEPPPPPPEQSFEPSSPDYPAAESSAEYQAPESAPAESARPAPVSGGGAPQFGGP
jgi:RNA polymerase sigma factor (sigma-70 family)